MNEYVRTCAQHIHACFYYMHYYASPLGATTTQAVYYLNKKLLEAEMTAKENAKRNGKPAAASLPFEAVKFVNRNLTSEEKEAHDAAQEPIPSLAFEWVKLALSGYTTKISWDSYSKCFQATLTVWNAACVNYGYGLSARGATPERACSLLLYKHFHVLNENWSQAYQAKASDMEG